MKRHTKHNLKVIALMLLILISLSVFVWLYFINMDLESKKLLAFFNTTILYVNILTFSLVFKSNSL